MEETNDTAQLSVAEQVEIQCGKSFPSTEFLQVVDQSDGCGAKLLVTIVSDAAFEKVPLIQRHRKVQKVLKDAGFGMDIVHAVTIQAWTVSQWEKKKNAT
mmetsp:Transcript_15920/g.20212  ORF Transcript_15920/g.20212 Transcript_15920/m.20212 type:complete len:100 (-) Transcript_15920:49-348(-)